MNIRECLKKNGWQIEVDYLGRYQSVDVDFINSDGNEDETQFDICGALTKAGEKELVDLYSDFCKENGFKTNTVISVTVVASADAMEELLNMEQQSNALGVISAKTPKEAYEKILEEYHKNDVCLGELFSQYEIRGLSVEDVVWVYSELRNDVDGDTLEMNGEAYNFKGRKWD